jgi:hypothetical protein
MDAPICISMLYSILRHKWLNIGCPYHGGNPPSALGKWFLFYRAPPHRYLSPISKLTASLIRIPFFGSFTNGHHDRSRRGQSESTRTRNHQHGNHRPKSVKQRRFATKISQPTNSPVQYQLPQNKNCGNLVHQCLYRGFNSTRLRPPIFMKSLTTYLYLPFAHGSKTTLSVQCAANTLSPGFFSTGRVRTDHAFVNKRDSFRYFHHPRLCVHRASPTQYRPRQHPK